MAIRNNLNIYDYVSSNLNDVAQIRNVSKQEYIILVYKKGNIIVFIIENK